MDQAAPQPPFGGGPPHRGANLGRLPQTRTSPSRLLALYLGGRTLVIGPGGLTVHRQTRGTVDRSVPIFGLGRLKRLGRDR